MLPQARSNLYAERSPVGSKSLSAKRMSAKRLVGETYVLPEQTYTFIPIAVETLGPMNSVGLQFLSDLARRITQVSTDQRESVFLFQRLSVLFQRFNAVAVRGTFALTPTEDDF